MELQGLCFEGGSRVMTTTRNLAILIFDEVEVLDFCGPFEVFSVANRFTQAPAFKVFTVADKPGPILTRGGLSVNPRAVSSYNS